MGLFGFIKDAGEKLFGSDDTASAPPPGSTAAPPSTAEKIAAANARAGEAIKTYIVSLQLAPPDLAVSFDGATTTATVSGTAPDQATRERILLAAGNVKGVSQVEDKLALATPEPEARFHTVVRGETLSAIAKQYYGNANKYASIFEANRPMLKHPDKIYPGQVLRIPPQS
ncbi:peptidoglycan-binding protein LysM [Azoarcus sp. TTM-91]|uniref:peptidoglycan-binding protein LysM n=1 Tax=Azoarcus sp. TTM-91 TaxID=2691581 RepID=UPI00145E3BCE|nr:peptidoglycan-binding protein LysM [Azoarcus sp. TTM-91]NMG37111.1 peptidoglycan-binding protein LysM [Azoarcus sp. TTM-91]